MKGKEVRIERVRRKGFAKSSDSAHSHPKLRYKNSQENYFDSFHKCSREPGIFKCIYNAQAIFMHQKQKKKKFNTICSSTFGVANIICFYIFIP